MKCRRLTRKWSNSPSQNNERVSAGFHRPYIVESLAERVGFEPTLPFRVNTLSKRAPSATRPSLRRKLRKKKTCFGKAFDCRVSEARLLGLILILWVMGAPAQIGNAQKCRGSSSERPRVRKAF